MIIGGAGLLAEAFRAVDVDPGLAEELTRSLDPQGIDSAALALPAALAGHRDPQWASVGVALGQARRWLDSASRWVDPAIHSIEPESDPLCGWLASQPDGAIALAGDGPLWGSARSALARSIVGDAGAVAVRDAVLGALSEVVPAEPAALVVLARRAFAEARSELEQRLVALQAERGPAVVITVHAEAERSVADAVSYLRDPIGWPRVAEVQRGGVAGVPGKRVARFFPVGMLLEELMAIEPEATSWAWALLREAGPRPLRYYDPWRGIPPDADSLGLALRLAARIRDTRGDPEGVLEALVRGWRAPLAPFGAGPRAPGTWLSAMPDGAPEWMVGACVAAQASLALGLIEWGAPGHQPLARVMAEDIGRTWDGERFTRVVFYRHPVAVRRFCELAAALTPSQRESLGVDAVARSVAGVAMASQGVRGGWGSPQRTAHTLRGLTLLCESQAAVVPRHHRLRAVRALVASQCPDGSWDEEEALAMPDVSGRKRWLKARDLTTAVCAAAVGVSGVVGGSE